MQNPFETLNAANGASGEGSMADYYPLIARAVAGLEKNTGENRRALYERARTALVAQLRGVDAGADGVRDHARAAGARRSDPQGRGGGGAPGARGGAAKPASAPKRRGGKIRPREELPRREEPSRLPPRIPRSPPNPPRPATPPPKRRPASPLPPPPFPAIGPRRSLQDEALKRFRADAGAPRRQRSVAAIAAGRARRRTGCCPTRCCRRRRPSRGRANAIHLRNSASSSRNFRGRRRISGRCRSTIHRRGPRSISMCVNRRRSGRRRRSSSSSTMRPADDRTSLSRALHRAPTAR